jgi:hypothetical protein
MGVFDIFIATLVASHLAYIACPILSCIILCQLFIPRLLRQFGTLAVRRNFLVIASLILDAS